MILRHAATRIALSFLLLSWTAVAFAPALHSTSSRYASSLAPSKFLGRGMRLISQTPATKKCSTKSTSSSSSSLHMFMGSDGGILGIGAPEVATILLVGYFILGPSDLYKLTKEIGKFIQNIRTLGTEATKTFENSMESQLELDELRKAQRELNDAFSFRRSINVEPDSDAFAFTANEADTGKGNDTLLPATETPLASTAATTTTTTTPTAAPKLKKIKRRRVKKQVPVEEEEAVEPVSINRNIPDLDMTDLDLPEADWPLSQDQLRKERLERLQQGTAQVSELDEDSPGWLETPDWMTEPPSTTALDPDEQDRFAKQLSGNWNQQILANEDKLSPLAKVMERLAILEEEKQAADARLEEEFRLRTQLEEKYYREKRNLLEEAAAEVQAAAYANLDDP